MGDVDARYQEGKIYSIKSNVKDLFYIGSTIHSLARRLQGHEEHYRRYQKGKAPYCSSFDVLATGDYDIVLYNKFPCHNKEQLELEEGYSVEYYMQYDGCVNKVIPGMVARAGGKKQYMKQYMKEMRKNTELIECDCGVSYRDCTSNRKRHFESAKHKYWEKHGEVKPLGNNSIQCECGGSYTINHRARHFKSVTHKKYLEIR